MSLDPKTSKLGKRNFRGVHPQFLDSLARVAEISEKKGYEPLNWVQAESECTFVSYLSSAAVRHICKFLSGEDYNVEIGLNAEAITEPEVLHLECAAYNLLMIATLFRQGRHDLDDRILKDGAYYDGKD